MKTNIFKYIMLFISMLALSDVSFGQPTISRQSAGTFVYINQPVNTDNINIVELSQMHGIQALATATEQRGANIGRIWIAAAISNTTAADTIHYFYSDDGGVSWTIYTNFVLAGSNQALYDQMDMEIIEDNTGDKYIWLVFGVTAPSGKQFSSVNVVKEPTFQAGAFTLTWPGENFNNTDFKRIRPRITSDNARYSNVATVYICAAMDTLDATIYRGWLNFAKCINPYTTSPTIDYIPESHLLTIGSSSPIDLQGDIAYMYNNGDYLMLVNSNIYTSHKNMAIDIVSTTFSLVNSTIFDGGNTYNKEYSRIAASGGTNQPSAMIVYRENYQNSGDWDIKALRTTDAGANWISQDVDTRRDIILTPNPPDIMGVRNRDGRYAITYSLNGISFDTLKYVTTNSGSTALFYRTFNHLSAFERPKAGVRLVDNDSCFTVWSEKGITNGNNIWATEGCNGQFTIGIQNIGNSVPTAYKLEQNYPNPFNPVTNIKFSIPKSGAVMLVVYGITGRLAAKLVDENLQAGSYKYDFDASNLSSGIYFYKLESAAFTETKKMILIK